MRKEIEVTFLIPCLNEEETIGRVIDDIKEFVKRKKINSEILVIDNGSSDKSSIISKDKGARVLFENKKGYGNALRLGIKEAKGKYIIMGDADTTYDFLNCDLFLDKLRDGNLFVIGNRYSGGIEKGGMSFSHYYGVKFLSYIGRKKYSCNVYDFHCGLRGVNSNFIKKIEFKATGMEFATEMIAEIVKRTDKIVEVPTKLKKCNYNRKAHLRTFRDGYRHLKFIIKN